MPPNSFKGEKGGVPPRLGGAMLAQAPVAPVAVPAAAPAAPVE